MNWKEGRKKGGMKEGKEERMGGIFMCKQGTRDDNPNMMYFYYI